MAVLQSMQMLSTKREKELQFGTEEGIAYEVGNENT